MPQASETPEPQAAVATMERRPAPPQRPRAATQTVPVGEVYPHVGSELRRIGLITALILAILVGLTFLLR